MVKVISCSNGKCSKTVDASGVQLGCELNCDCGGKFRGEKRSLKKTIVGDFQVPASLKAAAKRQGIIKGAGDKDNSTKPPSQPPVLARRKPPMRRGIWTKIPSSTPPSEPVIKPLDTPVDTLVGHRPVFSKTANTSIGMYRFKRFFGWLRDEPLWFTLPICVIGLLVIWAFVFR